MSSRSIPPSRNGDRGRARVVGLALMLAAGCAPAPTSPSPPALAVPQEPAPQEPAPQVPAWDLALDEADAERFAEMALACVHREYPNKISQVLAGPSDVAEPHAQTPVFYGCFDWHSAVHGHWLLVRLARRLPDAPLAERARAALRRSFSPEAIEAERRYLDRDDRAGFERPYGLAWLLQLCAELRAWDDPEAQRWAEALAPLERLAAQRIDQWVPKLGHPIRSGEHSQTGFALGLVLDWARGPGGDAAMAERLEAQVRRLHADDRECALHLEPSGHDFLSPCLGAADLVRRVLPPEELAAWLERALPRVPRDGSAQWLPLAAPSDRADGKLVHLDGLALSRAWMLDGIEHGLPADDPRRAALRAAALRQARAGLAAVSDEHYEGGHWLASFAVYLLTRRGRPSASAEAASGPR